MCTASRLAQRAGLSLFTKMKEQATRFVIGRFAERMALDQGAILRVVGRMAYKQRNNCGETP